MERFTPEESKQLTSTASRQFIHYDGCSRRDPSNCCACALTIGREGPNYAGWPLVYMQARRNIPSHWFDAFIREFQNESNPSYQQNLRRTLFHFGVTFTPRF